ncbi:MAG: glycosyltransferase [Muribaculaceae bacterium]
MISIITAIYNQLPMNKIFWEYLIRYTTVPFELIVIDNGSDDGSREFFQSLSTNYPVKVIANKANYSYPHCQNQGIALSKYDIMAFLNNDILLSAQWDKRICECIGKNGFDVLTLSGTDRIYDRKASKSIQHRWKHIKYPLRTLFGQRLFSLRLMTKICFGNWERYTDNVFAKYGYTLTYGFSGSAVVMNRAAISKIGEWDITQQAADFDLMMRTIKRSFEVGDIKPCAVVNGIFHHHFRRVSAKAVFPPYADKGNLITFEEKWEKEPELKKLCLDLVKFKGIDSGMALENPITLKIK